MNATIPTHLRPHTSAPEGRYQRQPTDRAPVCPHCGTRYRSASTREMVTWYYPRCQCAPPEGVVRLRPEK
jgi:hypothetical protein